jgi:hypothetical protein
VRCSRLQPISKQTLLDVIENYGRQSGPIRIEMPAGLEEIVPGYLASRRDRSSRDARALAASDYERLAILGHNLKGMALLMDFRTSARLALRWSSPRRKPIAKL